MAQHLLVHDTRVFHNKQWKSRKERFASRDKESREKLLLEQRPAQNGVKFVNYGRDLTAAPKGTVAHITEQDRFFTDFSQEEKRRRDTARKEKESYIIQKRYEGACKEEERWLEMDSRWAREDERQAAKMAKGNPRNQSSVPYNPLTLEYAENEDGELLRHKDNQILYRAAVRAENLRKHQNVHGFNPITGEQTQRVNVPSQPVYHGHK